MALMTHGEGGAEAAGEEFFVVFAFEGLVADDEDLREGDFKMAGPGTDGFAFAALFGDHEQADAGVLDLEVAIETDFFKKAAEGGGCVAGNDAGAAGEEVEPVGVTHNE